MSAKRFRSLLFKSAQLQQEIDKEHSRRMPDWMRLLKLKKLRLAMKDRMEKIAKQKVRAKKRRKTPVLPVAFNTSHMALKHE